jgi:3-oxoacyl-[acyl-carrier-protein] synthase II
MVAMNFRRVVVTGLGCVTPLGNDVPSSWRSIVEGRSGISSVTRFDASALPARFAGQVKGFAIEKYVASKEARHMDAFIHYGLAASIEAVEDAGLDTGERLDPLQAERIGCCIGSGIGGIPTIESAHTDLIERGARRVSPFFVPSSIINMVSGHVSIRFGFTGPNLAIATACTTGLHAIGLSARLIKAGDCEVMVCGGAEAVVSPLCLAGFAAARALSFRNEAPELASRPFDRDRDGFVLGEGSGVLVLEEYEHARARGAKIYAELVGFGMSGDAHHITAPTVDGPSRAMRAALRDAQINPTDVDYINAHGTSTPLGDANETQAIKQAFGEVAARRVQISSTKSMTGHLLGGAGGIESVFTVLSLRDQVIPPTINLDNPDPACDLDYCPRTARQTSLRYALKNNFGFGGTNGSLLFKRFE